MKGDQFMEELNTKSPSMWFRMLSTPGGILMDWRFTILLEELFYLFNWIQKQKLSVCWTTNSVFSDHFYFSQSVFNPFGLISFAIIDVDFLWRFNDIWVYPQNWPWDTAIQSLSQEEEWVLYYLIEANTEIVRIAIQKRYHELQVGEFR